MRQDLAHVIPAKRSLENWLLWECEQDQSNQLSEDAYVWNVYFYFDRTVSIGDIRQFLHNSNAGDNTCRGHGYICFNFNINKMMPKCMMSYMFADFILLNFLSPII